MGFWRASRGVNSEVRKILSQLEGKEPDDVTIPGGRGSLELAVSVASDVWLKSVLTNTGAWDISMWFVRDTEDGQLGTLVCLDSYRGRVRMVLNGTIEIADHNYTTFPFSGSNEDNSSGREGHHHTKVQAKVFAMTTFP